MEPLKAIEIAEEMRKGVLNSVIKDFVFEGNDLVKGRVLLTREHMNMSIVANVRFSLNGKDFQVGAMVPESQLPFDRTEAFKLLAAYITREIYYSLVLPVLGEELAKAGKAAFTIK
jgi:hypothetical protein